MQKFPQEKNSCMLINEISKLFHDKMRETCKKLGFKNGYRQILMFLAHNDGATQVELVRVSHLKAPTISVTLKKMEDEGLVRREQDKNDMRQTHVYLTEKGRALDRKHFDKLKALEGVMFEGLSPEEEETLRLTLKKVRDNLLAHMEKNQERNGPAAE